MAAASTCTISRTVALKREFGVSSVQQRASILGGEFKTQGILETGASILAEVPLPEDGESVAQEVERREQ